jgi:hypothetical protein
MDLVWTEVVEFATVTWFVEVDMIAVVVCSHVIAAG